MLHVFMANKTRNINEPVEKGLLASTTTISLRIEDAIEAEMKYIEYKLKREKDIN